jgi:hypothetical protein
MLFSELPILNNIIDELQLEDDGEESGDEMDTFFNEDEECEIIESLIQLMTDFIDSNPREISDPEFNYIIKENLTSNILKKYKFIILFKKVKSINEVYKIQKYFLSN